MSILSIRNLEKRFGDNVVLQNVNAEIERGEVISIIGPSGTGKSTLLRAINFLSPPTDGEVYFEGKLIDRTNVDAIRRKMNMVFQSYGLFSHLDVMGNLTCGPVRLLNQSQAEAEKNAMQILDSVGMTERARYRPTQLSGGQKQRVAIARCLAMRPDVILFDEPTSALDPAMVSEVMAVMRTLAKSGMTMLVVTHEMELARDIASRVFYMDDRGIYEQGTSEEIFKKPKKPKTQAFINNIRSFRYEISSRAFDYVEMLGGIENFCFRHAIADRAANKLRLLAEELVINIVTPQFGACVLNVSYSEKLETYELAVSYTGENRNALDSAADKLSVMVVQKSAQEIRHEYVDGENILTAML